MMTTGSEILLCRLVYGVAALAVLCAGASLVCLLFEHMRRRRKGRPNRSDTAVQLAWTVIPPAMALVLTALAYKYRCAADTASRLTSVAWPYAELSTARCPWAWR